MIGEGLYECGSCGHCWDPEVIEDLDSIVCEICAGLDVFVREVREGSRRGVAHAAERDQRAWAAAAETHREAVRARSVQEQAEARRVAAERKKAQYQWEREQEEDGTPGLLPRRVRARLNKGYWDAWRKEHGVD
jgi:hypothetical protein